MADLVKALREGIEPYDGIETAEQIMDLAANEIERLRDALCQSSGYDVAAAMFQQKLHEVEAQRDALLVEVTEWRECAQYDPLNGGAALQGMESQSNGTLPKAFY